ncbi:hypothetical protein [uncultured Draconibacterium sp.]|uniref:hypothetical protein n=1 Tax=uncultured Draconibacterium sp. TaxID=1573823 RepID=UPI0032613A79
MLEDMRQQIASAAIKMREWEEMPRVSDEEEKQIIEHIALFDHSDEFRDVRISGVDGSGDYPTLSYNDSFVYVTVAQGSSYRSHRAHGLQEEESLPPLIRVTWLPASNDASSLELRDDLADLAGEELLQTLANSDYRSLKARLSRKDTPPVQLAEHLLLPHAHDAGNLRIQLCSTAEFGMALRIIKSSDEGAYVLVDTTMSLPLVTRKDASLFFEHVKRRCCSEARDRGVRFLALSKSHGLPSIGLIEGLAREKGGLPEGASAEHWFLRLPVQGIDGWAFSLAEERLLPPPGAITYLVRFHRTTPVMRLDMDRRFWEEHIKGDELAEQALFQDLDYACHDQRCYGYPYPIHAGMAARR